MSGNKKLIISLLIMMLLTKLTYSQHSYELFGFSSNQINSEFRLNSFESNAGNYSLNKDWEFSAIYGAEVNDGNVSSNIFLISLGKKLNNDYFYARYTPGILAKFIINTGIELILDDTTKAKSLSNLFEYKEIFGAGYSHSFGENFSIGFSVRLFQQKTEEDVLDIYYDTEETAYFVPVTEIKKTDYWIGDIGATYNYNELMKVSIQSVNLFTVKEADISEKKYSDLNTNKEVIFGLTINPYKNISLQSFYETNNSYMVGLNGGFSTGIGNISFGISASHNNNIDDLISSVTPSINYSNNFLSISAIGSIFMNNNKTSLSKDNFKNLGIGNIINNRYSNDRILLAMNLALSFKPEKKVKIISLKADEQIFPTLAENYLTKPFATATVINLTNETITVKPSSYIRNLNKEAVYSPIIKASPRDTFEIPFYTIIGEEFSLINSRTISDVHFYLTTENNEPDDEIQKPILINDKNSWDGKIINLKHFVNSDLNFISKYSKQILNNNRTEIENSVSDLENFVKIKILFENFAKQMLYVSDPRSAVEYVQFPSETLNIKGGDCDDLTVCFAAMLEGIGIETAFIDYKNEDKISHVSLLVNTKLKPDQSSLITNNDKKIFIRKNNQNIDEIWIPIETTSFVNFNSSWEIGALQFYKEAITDLGLVKNKVEIIDIY
ncbi:MAG: hypothetical protein JEY94_10735 [Melioribacteraceae bacterium]|nr:hypothetical protein [Melioribacteraceae bacterium]